MNTHTVISRHYWYIFTCTDHTHMHTCTHAHTHTCTHTHMHTHTHAHTHAHTHTHMHTQQLKTGLLKMITFSYNIYTMNSTFNILYYYEGYLLSSLTNCTVCAIILYRTLLCWRSSRQIWRKKVSRSLISQRGTWSLLATLETEPISSSKGHWINCSLWKVSILSLFYYSVFHKRLPCYA